MKKIYFIAILFISACSSGPSEMELIEQKESIEKLDETWEDFQEKFYSSYDKDIKESMAYYDLKQFKYNKFDTVAQLAKAHLDSVDVMIKRDLKMRYESLFEYAKKKNWNSISKEEAKKIESKFLVQNDFEKSTLYRHPSSPKFINYNGCFLLYSKAYSDTDPGIYLRFQYAADDWLFIKKAKISIDGEIWEALIDEWERDNSDGKIFEWGEENLHSFNLIVNMLNAKTVKLRYSGDQYYDDRSFTAAQKSAMEEMLKVYYILYIKDKIKF